MFDETEEVWINLLPVYWWLGSEADSPSCAYLGDNHDDMLPATCYRKFRERYKAVYAGFFVLSFSIP